MKALFTSIFLFFLLGSSNLEAATFTWVGGDGDWSDASNWDCDCNRPYPGNLLIFLDEVTFPSFTSAIVNINISPSPLAGLNMYNPNVTLEGGPTNNTLTIKGTMNWFAGNIDAGITINESGECNINNSLPFVPFDKVLHGTLINKGTITQNGWLTLVSGAILENENIHNYGMNADLTLELGARYRNIAGSKFTTSEDGGVIDGDGEFFNYGIFKFPANNGGGDLYIHPNFYNNFEYKQTTGDRSVFFEGELFNNPNGTFFLGQNSDVHFRGGGELKESSTMNGSGQLFIENDFVVNESPDSRFNLRILGGSEVYWNANSETHKLTIDMSNGELKGNGSITVDNEFLFHNGTLNIRVSLTSTAEGTINPDGTGLPVLKRSITNSGVIRQKGDFTVDPDGTLTNHKDYYLSKEKDLKLRTNAWFGNYDNLYLTSGTVSGGGNFSNYGSTTALVTLPGINDSFTFNADVWNLGVFNFIFWNNVTFTGLFRNTGSGVVTLNDNATLEVHSGSFYSGSSLRGAKKLVILGGFSIDEAPVNRIELDFASSGGNISWNVPYVTNKVTLRNDIGDIYLWDIGGAGILHIIDTFDFKGGRLDLPVIVRDGATCRISGDDPKRVHDLLELNGNTIYTAGGNLTLFETGSIINNGTFNWEGGQINLRDPGSIFTNNGLFEVLNNRDFSQASLGTFINNDTFKKTGGTTGPMKIFPWFENHGDFQQSVNGIISFEHPVTNPGKIEGIGSLIFKSNFNCSGSLSPGLPLGVLNLTREPFHGPLGLTTAGTTFIDLAGYEGPGGANGNDQIAVEGNVELGGTLDVSFLNGFQPAGNDEFVIMTCTSCSGSFDDIISPPGEDFEVDLSTPSQVILRKTGLLPVELIGFRAKAKGSQVLLNWETATEQNNLGFDVQRSAEERNWLTVGFVNGGGTTFEQKDYSFVDLPGIDDAYYYRLRQIDLDGHFTFSPIRTVTLNSTENILRVFPNPVESELTLEFNNSWEGNVKVQVVNSLGQVVIIDQFIKSSDGFKQVMDLASLPGGNYRILLSNADQFITQSFVRRP